TLAADCELSVFVTLPGAAILWDCTSLSAFTKDLSLNALPLIASTRTAMEKSSLIIIRPFSFLFINRARARSLEEPISKDQHIHFRAEKALKRFFRTADDRFVFIEGRV